MSFIASYFSLRTTYYSVWPCTEDSGTILVHLIHLDLLVHLLDHDRILTDLALCQHVNCASWFVSFAPCYTACYQLWPSESYPPLLQHFWLRGRQDLLYFIEGYCL